MTFSDAGNTSNPALLTVAEMGYLISVTYDPEFDKLTWTAAKDGVRIEADSPLTLLGMAVLRETPGSQGTFATNSKAPLLSRK